MATVTREHIEQFKEEGYVKVQGVLDLEQDLQPVIDEYSALLDTLSRTWHEEGRISSTYGHLPFEERIIQIAVETEGQYNEYLDISLTMGEMGEDIRMHHGPAVFDLLRSPRLLDAVETFIGHEIYSNPVQHLRVKPPERFMPKTMHSNANVGKTPWHQDQGVVIEEADQTEMLTVWVPVMETTIENGCLAVMPGSHKEGLIFHCMEKEGDGHAYVSDRLLTHGQVPVPMKAGDALFMTKFTAHCSLPNVSDGIRWSFDLRYNPIGQPTGRPWFPGFVARSRSHPEWELRDPEEWGRVWQEAGIKLSQGDPPPDFYRWKADDPRCA